MKVKNVLLYAIILTVIISCGESKKPVENTQPATDKYTELNKTARSFFGVLPQVAENPENLITEEKVALGKKLYFDNRLSKDNTQSCNTCHNLDTYGVDNLALSIGNDGGPGGRNSPTTFNAALHISQFWNGSEPDVEAQAGGPILNPVEMAMPSEKAVVDKLSKIDEYVEMFSNVFPEDKPALTYNNIKKAIGAYERKLITPSKFDDYIAGDDNALNDNEKEGLQTFLNVGCGTCHPGALLGGNMYQKFGLYGDYWELTKSENIDIGRADFTNKETDKYIFKVPSLRNVEKTYPYFHDGSIMDIKEAVSIIGKTQLNKELTEKEINDIVIFMNTLTGEIPEEMKE